MAAPKRTKFQRERDLAVEAGLYLKGSTQEVIAVEIGVSQSQVSLDLTKVKRRWQREAVRDFDEARAIELAKLAHLERTYWLAWEASRADSEATVTERQAIELTDRASGVKVPAERLKVSVRRENNVGNPAFLAGVLSVIDKRMRLLGLDAPQRLDIEANLTWVERARQDRAQEGKTGT